MAMFRYTGALLCVLFLISSLNPISAKRSYGGGSRHSYPKSGGLSGGGGGHHYPSSGGLSGGGHGYPSSGGSHGYPPSGGLSGGGRGYPSSSGNHGYPSSGGAGSHAYPSSGGLSGGGTRNGHGYPSGGGLSGNSAANKPATNVHYHNHYNYNPPQQIRYTPAHGGAPVNYPVYHGSPPTYVYQYKDSGSKYGTLLAGLALLNLGTLAGSVYANTHRSSSTNYRAQPGEVCKFGLKKKNGDYEEVKIDCNIISSFIFEEQAKAQSGVNNTVVTTTTVTNVTTANGANGVVENTPAPANVNTTYIMLPNGTLVPVNTTETAATNATQDAPNNNTMASSVVTTTTTNTTTVSALELKGKEVDVTPDMQCYVMRHTSSSNMKRSVPCGLLKTYADTSLKKNSAIRNAPAFTILTVALVAFVFN